MKLSEAKPTPSLIKMILMGFSGKGKSTSLIPLAIPDIISGFPGYELRVLDFDGKFQEVAQQNLAARKNKGVAGRNRLRAINDEQYAAALANIDIEVIRENTKTDPNTGNISIIGQPKGWTKLMKIMERWVKDAGPGQILVLDSWTHMTQTPLLAYCMALQNKSLSDFGSGPHGRDYIHPQNLAKNLLTILADFKSHVIICTHQEAQDIERKTGEMEEKKDGSKEPVSEVVHSEMVPISVGSKGRIAIPSQFNHTLVVHSDTQGRRQISTQPEDGVTTKSPFWAVADKNYPLAEGMVSYWMLGDVS